MPKITQEEAYAQMDRICGPRRRARAELEASRPQLLSSLLCMLQAGIEEFMIEDSKVIGFGAETIEFPLPPEFQTELETLIYCRYAIPNRGAFLISRYTREFAKRYKTSGAGAKDKGTREIQHQVGRFIQSHSSTGTPEHKATEESL